jgi:putative transposase
MPPALAAVMSNRTFAISSSSAGGTHLFQSDRMKHLFIEVLRDYRRKNKFLLHAFVMMPTHIHLLITPASTLSLEKCIQLIKGNFSYRTKKEFEMDREIWTPGFNPHRVKDEIDYKNQVRYIHNNPVKAGLVASPELYECSSAWPGRKMDPSPFVARAKAQSV